MNDVSVFGAVVTVIGSATFPVGFTVTQFADDADPFDIPKITITDKAMGANGDLVTWGKPTPIDIAINVINGSTDDVNLATLFEANRIGRGKTGARDIITVTAVYADGRTITLTNGKIAGGMPGESMSSAGRLKTKGYDFFFENMVRTGGL